MNMVLLYLLKANSLLIFFWLFYRLFLKKETFYTFNRLYFMTTIAASFMFPLITFTQTVVIKEEPSANIPVRVMLQDSDYIVKTGEKGFIEALDWQETFVFITLMIGLLLVFVSVLRIVKLFISIGRLPRIADSNIRITHSENNVYSFYRWIVVPRNIFNWPDYQMVLDHENVHLNQKHTIDLIVIELVAKVFWFNPLIRCLQKDLYLNLEFLVDEAMIRQHEPVSYQNSLLYLRNQPHIAFTNAFTSSDLKKRIIQLNSLKSNPMKKFKILMTAPALFLFFSMFQTETIAQVISISEKQSATEVVTLDPSFTKSDLKAFKQDLKRRFNIDLTINKVSYNNGKIQYLKYTLKKDSYKISGALNAKSAIKPMSIVISGEDSPIPFSVKENYGQPVHAYAFTTTDFSDAVAAKADLKKTATFFINDKESSQEAVSELDPNSIVSINIDKNNTVTGANSNADGIIRIITSGDQDNDTPAKISFQKRIQDQNAVKETANMYLFSDTEINEEDIENLDPKTIRSIYAITGSDKKGKKAAVHLSTRGTDKIINKNSGKQMKTIIIKSDDLNGNFVESESISSKNGVFTFKKATSFQLDGANKQPLLYVIDGKETNKEAFSKIDPKKIKSITILKDDSAVKKYGDKAKNGVIEITTGEASLSFREYASEIKNKEWAVQIRKQTLEKRKEALSERKRILENRKKEIENILRSTQQKNQNS